MEDISQFCKPIRSFRMGYILHVSSFGYCLSVRSEIEPSLKWKKFWLRNAISYVGKIPAII